MSPFFALMNWRREVSEKAFALEMLKICRLGQRQPAAGSSSLSEEFDDEEVNMSRIASSIVQVAGRSAWGHGGVLGEIDCRMDNDSKRGQSLKHVIKSCRLKNWASVVRCLIVHWERVRRMVRFVFESCVGHIAVWNSRVVRDGRRRRVNRLARSAPSRMENLVKKGREMMEAFVSKKGGWESGLTPISSRQLIKSRHDESILCALETVKGGDVPQDVPCKENFVSWLQLIGNCVASSFSWVKHISRSLGACIIPLVIQRDWRSLR